MKQKFNTAEYFSIIYPHKVHIPLLFGLEKFLPMWFLPSKSNEYVGGKFIRKKLQIVV